uniref:Uncharacterized protein n=1 Tax=Arundo donax TaxID=35708 RepID=A0A0A8ZMV1_ARUDO
MKVTTDKLIQRFSSQGEMPISLMEEYVSSANQVRKRPKSPST